MKKAFLWIATLATTMLLAITSCSNASQITFENEEKTKLTTDGLGKITINIGKTPIYRSYYPEDWTDQKKQKLFFKLTGVDSVNPTYADVEPAPTVKNNIDSVVGQGAEFTFTEVDSGRAIVQLDPIHWDLTLTAYEGKEKVPGPGLELDETKPVLKAEVLDVDLTKGAADVIFNLTPYDPLTAAAGQVDVQVNFYLNKDSPAKNVDINIVNKAGVGAKTALIMQGASAPADPGIPVTIPSSDFAGSSDYKTINLLTKPESSSPGDVIGVKPGEYDLVVTFKDAQGKVILPFTEKITVDGGNLTKANITIPADAFNAPPKVPTELRASSYFAPASGKVVIDESKKLYGQEVVASGSDVANASSQLAAAIQDNKYNLVLKWNDNSFSERGFQIDLTTTRPDNNAVRIVYNKDNTPTVDVLYGPDYAAPDTAGAATGITVVPGTDDLGPGCETITLAVPTGIFCKDITVTAVNELGEGKSAPIANSTTYDPTGLNIPAVDPIGMFTVAYNLVDPNAANAIIRANPGTVTTNAFFVMAHNYGAKDALITNNLNAFPHVENAKYNFNGWMFADSPDPIKVATLEEFEMTDPMGSGKGKLSTDNSNKNVEVYGSWTTPATIKVTYPSYSEYKKLSAVIDQNPTNTIIPEFTADNKQVVTLTIGKVADSVAQITDMKFVIYDPYKDATPIYESGASVDSPNTPLTGVTEKVDQTLSGETGGNSMTWNVTDYLAVAGNHGDVFRINVSYKYALANSDGGFGTPVTIDGNLFVKISK